MADSFIVIPDSGVSTGSKVRTQTVVVSSETVHQHYFTLTDESGNDLNFVTAADDLSNPTAPQVLAHVMGYDEAGANWDRARLAKLHDLDSGAGSELNIGVSLREASSGGSIALGTSSRPMQVSLQNNVEGSAPVAIALIRSDVTQNVDLTSQNGLFSVVAGGDHAHDALDTSGSYSYPMKIGGKALTSRQTAVSNNDRTNAYYDEYGRAIVAFDYDQRSDTYTTTANGTTIDTSRNPLKYFTIYSIATGAVTSWTIVVEGSLDGTNFFTLATATNAAPTGYSSDATNMAKPVRYFRSRCSAIVLGGGTNVIAYILGVV